MEKELTQMLLLKEEIISFMHKTTLALFSRALVPQCVEYLFSSESQQGLLLVSGLRLHVTTGLLLTWLIALSNSATSMSSMHSFSMA